MGRPFLNTLSLRTLVLAAATTACVSTQTAAPVTGNRAQPYGALAPASHTQCAGYELAGSVPGKEQAVCAALMKLGAQYQIAKGVLRLPHAPAEHGLTELLRDAHNGNIIDGDRSLSGAELSALEKTAKYVWQTAREREEAEQTYVRSA